MGYRIDKRNRIAYTDGTSWDQISEWVEDGYRVIHIYDKDNFSDDNSIATYFHPYVQKALPKDLRQLLVCRFTKDCSYEDFYASHGWIDDEFDCFTDEDESVFIECSLIPQTNRRAVNLLKVGF